MRLMSFTSWERIFTTIRDLSHTFMFYILKFAYLYRSRGFFLINIFLFPETNKRRRSHSGEQGTILEQRAVLEQGVVLEHGAVYKTWFFKTPGGGQKKQVQAKTNFFHH